MIFFFFFGDVKFQFCNEHPGKNSLNRHCLQVLMDKVISLIKQHHHKLSRILIIWQKAITKATLLIVTWVKALRIEIQANCEIVDDLWTLLYS